MNLQIQQLCRVRTMKDIGTVLNRLPDTLRGSYDVVYSNIMEMGETSIRIAIQTLQVLLSAKRLLDKQEMVAAVMVDLDHSEALANFDADTGSIILDVCQNPVIFDNEIKGFRLAHHSVREYLLEPRLGLTAINNESFLLDRSLYVFLCVARDITPKVEQEKHILNYDKDFASYTTKYWPGHCKIGQPEEVTSTFLRMFIADKGTGKAFEEWRLCCAVLAARNALTRGSKWRIRMEARQYREHKLFGLN